MNAQDFWDELSEQERKDLAKVLEEWRDQQNEQRDEM